MAPSAGKFPYLEVSAGLLLTWRFNSIRGVWAIALIVLVERVFALTTPFAGVYVLLFATVRVPLYLALFSWWSERGFFTMHGLLRLSSH